TAAGNLVLQQAIFDTDQDDLEEYSCNWYPFVPLFPFTRGDVLSNGGMHISILGSGVWGPESLFVYGLDTAAGRPNEVVDVLSLPEWTLGIVTAQPTILPLILRSWVVTWRRVVGRDVSLFFHSGDEAAGSRGIRSSRNFPEGYEGSREEA